MRTVGLVFTSKKINGSGFIGLEAIASQHDLRVVFIDLARPIEEQGPLDIIVHKMTDVIANMERGDVACRDQYQRFMQFCASHPNVVILDPWPCIEKVLDRQNILEQLIAASSKASAAGPLFNVPSSLAMASLHDLLEAQHVAFPAICKRRTACSSAEAHMMTLIPSRQSMAQLDQFYSADEPLLLQQFVQHDGVLIKVYVLDGQIYTSARPSFRNVYPSTVKEDQTAVTLTEAVHFDSQMLPKQFGLASDLPSRLDRLFLSQDPLGVHQHTLARLDHDRLERIAHALHRQLDLTFFGFDVVLASGTDDYYVVDVNYFPGFKQVPHFHQAFIDIVLKRLEQSHAKQE